MIISFILAFVLIGLTSGLHFGALSFAQKTCRGSWNVLGMMFWMLMIAVLAHLVEIFIYAGGFMLAEKGFEIGSFAGLKPMVFMDYVYFSIVSYTSLGLGDIFPLGHLRFLTGVEALNGLILIAWTATYTFYAAIMKRMGKKQ